MLQPPLGRSGSGRRRRPQGVGFYSTTYRLDGLELDCKDHGQAVVYHGGIAGHDQRLVLDKHHAIEAGRVFPVCRNTWRMLQETRSAPHFDVIGDVNQHYGIFCRVRDHLALYPERRGIRVAMR